MQAPAAFACRFRAWGRAAPIQVSSPAAV